MEVYRRSMRNSPRPIVGGGCLLLLAVVSGASLDVRQQVTGMTKLQGILYQSGNVDFPQSANDWAFARLQKVRRDQQKRIIMHPEVAPLVLTRSPELDPAATPWLNDLAEIVNACDTVNLQLRESSLRLRQAVCDIDTNQKLVVLVSQDAVDEFVREHWQRMAFFYAQRHDGFRFDISTMISMKDREPRRPHRMELVARVVGVEADKVPRITFDATGSQADVHVVEWRGEVPEGETGLYKDNEVEVRISLPLVRQPIIFLYEKRPEFQNRAYTFMGDKLTKQLRRVLKKAQQRSPAD